MEGVAFKPMNLNKDYLDRQRLEADPLGDSVVEKLFAGKEMNEINQQIGTTLSNLQQDKNLPGYVQEYLHESTQLPGWADPLLIKKAQNLFENNGLLAFTILGGASLPECYVYGDAVQVLFLTQKLVQNVYRRVVATGEMITKTMSVGGLAEHSDGRLIISRVRLMHAANRYLILKKPSNDEIPNEPASLVEVLAQEDWAAKENKPINQLEMAYTILTFSYVGIRSIERLGTKVSQEDKDAYIHAWNVVGHMLGLKQELMAENYQQAEKLFASVQNLYLKNTPEGVALNNSLINFVSLRAPIIGKPMILKLMRTYLNEASIKVLEIPKLSFIHHIILFVVSSMIRIVGLGHMARTDTLKASGDRLISEFIFRILVKKFMKLKKTFYIPTHLAKSWKFTKLK